MSNANAAGLVAPIPASVVDRLAKIAGMLGRDHPGEVAAAGFQATKLLREHKLSWRELVEAAGPRAPERPPTPPPRPPDPPWLWEYQIEVVAARPWRLTDWERQFVASLQRWGKRPSDKQLAVLSRLYLKVTDR